MSELFIFLTLICIFISMILSASEASIFSLTRIDLASLKSLGLRDKYLNMINNTEQLLFALLTGNELADYFASLCFASAVTLLLSDDFRTPAFFIFSILSFFFADFFPKVAGFRLRAYLVTKIIPLTYVLFQVFYPFRIILYKFYLKINKLFPVSIENHSIKSLTPVEQIIIYALEIAYRDGKISKTEKEFIYGLFLSEKISVSAIMTQRSEIIAFKDQPLSRELLNKFKVLPYNKYPIYKNNFDEIIGILYTKDLLNHFARDKNILGKYLSEFCRPAYFVPEHFPVRDLLFEFQKKNLKIALVVDEYGAVKGLVTLEDLVEELFGEILPAKDEPIEPIQVIGEKRYLISGKALLEEVKTHLGLNVEEEIYSDLTTMNGLILALFEGIPKEGEVRNYRGWTFKIKKVRGRKILWIEAERTNSD